MGIIDIMFYLFLIGFIGVPIYLIIKSKKKKQNGQVKVKNVVEKVKVEEKPKEKKYDKIDLTHMAGLENVQKSQDCKVILYDDRVNIIFNKSMEYNLKNENIKSMSVLLAKDLLDKKKSTVLRGLVGNALAGPGGLILGGMSSLNKSQKSAYVLVVNYISKDKEEKSIVFGMKYNKVMAENFIKKFEKLTNRSMKSITEL